MSDPLSPLASVITIAGGAFESIRTLATILRRFRNAPAQVHQWLAMLESLSSTLSSLQQCGGHLELRLRFPLNFRQRLHSCVSKLQRNISEIAKIDAELLRRSPDGRKQWDYRTRRSWERAKWAFVGHQRMKKVMELANMYHFEFVMELLKIVIFAQPSHLPPPILSGVPSRDPLQQQGLNRRGNQLELLQPALTITDTCSAVEGTVVMPSDCLPNAITYDHPNTHPAATIPTNQSHTWVKPAILIHRNILACSFRVRAGPVLQIRPYSPQEAQSGKHQQTGLGLVFSVYLPRQLRQILGLALLTFQMRMTSRTTQALYCNVNLPNTVPPDAEIFKYTRAGSIQNVQRLLSRNQGSASDITILGTTLLHLASKAGNMQLTRLLIQEGADVNAQDEDGESPLHGAMARSGNYDVARILIENGADLSSKAVDGKTTFHNIFNDTIGSVLMRDDWLEHVRPDSEGMSISHFLAWSSRSTPQTFQRGRLCDDADLLSTDSLGRTCLHFAASRGNLGVLSYLVSRVSPDDVDRRDGQGRTPFHYAVESSRARKVIDLLMDQGCNIYAADKSGRTALHWAARWGNFVAAEKLLEVVGGECLLLSYANGRLPSREVCQRRAPALYRYLRGVEASSGLGTEQFSTMRLDRECATHGIGVAFPLVVEVVGLVILTCMVLLGLPD